MFRSEILPGAVSAWHSHDATTDRLFVARGELLIVLFDARDDSPTCGSINKFRFGVLRPALTLVPPGVWHGVRNVGVEAASLVDMVDRAYSYDEPDHWSVPEDSPDLPYDIVHLTSRA